MDPDFDNYGGRRLFDLRLDTVLLLEAFRKEEKILVDSVWFKKIGGGVEKYLCEKEIVIKE